MPDSTDRLMAALPAIYRATDTSGHLGALLSVFEQVLLESRDASAPAFAEQIEAIAPLFAPIGVETSEKLLAQGAPMVQGQTPEHFLPWLAQWVSFSPYRYFPAERLRAIIAGIVPLYGSRGTRQYLEKLLKLCFDEISELSIDEHPLHGLMIGRARLGETSVLATEEPFRFRVEIRVDEGSARGQVEPWQALEERVRAIVDFARPAHTEYELVLRRGTANA